MTDVESEGEIDLEVQRKTRAVQNRVAIRLRNKLQSKMDKEDAITLDLHELQSQETCIETALRRATRSNDLLVENETNSITMEEDDKAWDTFLGNINTARRLCQELIALRVSSSLIASAEPLLDTYQSRREANPDKDYSNFAS